VYLASSDSKYLTGEISRVTGVFSKEQPRKRPFSQAQVWGVSERIKARQSGAMGFHLSEELYP